jgi:murein DD-endopeptidase MepM/ murein hydrolase activator NlpD
MRDHHHGAHVAKADRQPWMLASFAMGALITTAFAAVAGVMSGTPQGQVLAPIVTAGWAPAAPVETALLDQASPAAATQYPAAARTYATATQAGAVSARVFAAKTEPEAEAAAQPVAYGARSALAALDDAAAVAVLGEDPPPASPTLDSFVSDPDPVVTPVAPEAEDETDEPDIQTVTVERGDTLSAILAEAGVAEDDIATILTSIKKVYDPTAIKPGRRLTLTLGRVAAKPGAPKSTVLLSLKLRPTIQREIVVERRDDGAYESAEIVKTLTEKTDRVQGVINGSLYQAAMNAGVPESAIQELIRIYSYDVDFQRDIQAGDKFEVLFTRYYDDQGVPVKLGTVLHATLTLQGERKPLYRFTDPDGQTTDYYTAQGTNGKRMLMKTPIDGARLSSGFGMRRHPILGFNKLHRGTDFAAPTGTPIMASGNGVVEVAGVAGGYGNYVRIRHNDTYKTAYAHLHRFARGMKTGAKVRQGQIIGYVGSTGRSTGPHLHYEVMANNRYVDSQSVKLPTGTLLTGKDMAAFKAEKERLDDVLKATPLINNMAARKTESAQP